jgi:hypothetical protein
MCPSSLCELRQDKFREKRDCRLMIEDFRFWNVDWEGHWRLADEGAVGGKLELAADGGEEETLEIRNWIIGGRSGGLLGEGVAVDAGAAGRGRGDWRATG